MLLIYIFGLGSFFRGAAYRSLTFASIRLHISWLSADSRFQASAIACAGDRVGRGGKGGIQALCGGRESEVICAEIWPIRFEIEGNENLRFGRTVVVSGWR